MSKISKPKIRILELLWSNNNPMSNKEISERLELKSRSVNMHLLGLRKKEYVSKTKDGSYTITGSGKAAIGFPETDKQLAKKVLAQKPPQKAFHFYRGMNQPTGISSDSLVDFCKKLKTVHADAVEFHATRGDFEMWVASLGDVELAKRLQIIRGIGLAGEDLRKELYKAVKSRCDELLAII
jgi:DNA-binding transcriptional ArsR family regulator